MRKWLFQLFLTKAEDFKVLCEDNIAAGEPLGKFFVNAELRDANPPFSIHLQEDMSKELYDEITSRFFQSKSDINIFRPISQAMTVAKEIDASFDGKKLDLILYTGGASRMAGVAAALDCYFFSPETGVHKPRRRVQYGCA